MYNLCNKMIKEKGLVVTMLDTYIFVSVVLFINKGCLIVSACPGPRTLR